MDDQNPYQPSRPSSTGYQSGNQALGDKVSEAASQARDKASELGRAAVDKLDESRTSTAGALHSAASSLRDSARGSAETVSNLANTAASKLDSTASYVRERDVRGMLGDVHHFVKSNPGPSLLVAVAFGFLIGSAVRRD